MDSFLPIKKTNEELVLDIKECLVIIKVNIDLYDTGFKPSYKTISAQMRLLLCDNYKRQNNSLLLKIFPDAKLHPVSFIPDFEKYKEKKGRLLFFMSGSVSTNSNRIENIFDITKTPITLEKWLSQNILDDTLTIKKLIKSVANKDGGAHVDSNYDDVLRKTKSTIINNDSANSIYLVEISRYVITEISSWLVNND